MKCAINTTVHSCAVRIEKEAQYCHFLYKSTRNIKYHSTNTRIINLINKTKVKICDFMHIFRNFENDGRSYENNTMFIYN